MVSQRIIAYVQRVFYLRDYAKDLKLSDAPKLIKKIFNDAVDNLINNVKKYGGKILFWDSILKICSFIFSVLGIIIYLTIKAYKGFISTGSFPALYNAATNLNSYLQDLLEIIPNLYENNLYIERFNKFMSYKPENISGSKSLKQVNKIEFRNVDFSYNPNYLILKNINLIVQKGKKIASVGYNGAGKTTLVNLLLKLYLPTSGEILINDENINEYDNSEYLKRFCVVTQDFKLFALTIAENIIYKTDISEQEKDKIINSLKNTGLYDKIMLSSKGIDSQYSKEFYEDGLLFSGGEEQKLAISKIFLTNSDVIILDEPSSAIDPVSEYNMPKLVFANSNLFINCNNKCTYIKASFRSHIAYNHFRKCIHPSLNHFDS